MSLHEFFTDYARLLGELRNHPDRDTIMVATDIAAENERYCVEICRFLERKVDQVSLFPPRTHHNVSTSAVATLAHSVALWSPLETLPFCGHHQQWCLKTFSFPLHAAFALCCLQSVPGLVLSRGVATRCRSLSPAVARWGNSDSIGAVWRLHSSTPCRTLAHTRAIQFCVLALAHSTRHRLVVPARCSWALLELGVSLDRLVPTTSCRLCMSSTPLPRTWVVDMCQSSLLA